MAIESFFERAGESGYGVLPPADWTRGVRVGSQDEKVWFEIIVYRAELSVELIHAGGSGWTELLALLVEFADEHDLRIEVRDWRKRDDLPVCFPGAQFSRVLKRHGFKSHLWEPKWIREPFDGGR